MITQLGFSNCTQDNDCGNGFECHCNGTTGSGICVNTTFTAITFSLQSKQNECYFLASQASFWIALNLICIRPTSPKPPCWLLNATFFWHLRIFMDSQFLHSALLLMPLSSSRVPAAVDAALEVKSKASPTLRSWEKSEIISWDLAISSSNTIALPW